MFQRKRFEPFFAEGFCGPWRPKKPPPPSPSSWAGFSSSLADSYESMTAPEPSRMSTVTFWASSFR